MAWSGPLEILERLNQVNYRIKDISGKGRAKVVHVNTLKKYVERDEPVRRLTVVAEEGRCGSVSNVRLKTRTSEYVEEDVENI